MDADRQVVIFQLATGSFALDIASVQEIIRLPTLTPVPQALPHVVGIANLRGAIVQDAREGRLLRGVARLQDRLVLLLDLSKVVAHDDLESLAALVAA